MMQNPANVEKQRIEEHLSDKWNGWSPRVFRAVQIILFILPFAVYSTFVYQKAVDVPIYDDYDAIVEFVNRFVQSDDTLARIKLVFAPLNEHRIVLTKVASLADYYLFHHLDFRRLTMWGAAGWVFTVLALVFVVKRRYSLPLTSVLAIPYILLAFVHTEGMHFATAGLTEYWVIMFCILFLACLASNKTAWSTILFPAAVFTHGGGVVLYPIGAFFLSIRKQWKALLVFRIGAGICAAVYFHNWRAAYGVPSVSANIAKGEMIISWFFAFLGNATGSLQAAIPAGLLSFVVLVVILVQRTDDALLFLLTSYVLLVAATVSLTRSGLGNDMAVRSGYAMYCLLGWVCIYIFGITMLKDPVVVQKTVLVVLALVMVFFFGFFLKWHISDPMANWNTVEVKGLVRFAAGDKDGLLYYDKERAAQLLLDAQRLKVYDYEKNFRPVVVERGPADFPTNSEMQLSIDEQAGSYVAGWAFVSDFDATLSHVSLVLADGQRIFQITTSRVKRPDVSLYFKSHRYDNAGYEVAIPVEKLPPGSYKIGILVESGDKSAFQWTDKVFTLKDGGTPAP